MQHILRAALQWKAENEISPFSNQEKHFPSNFPSLERFFFYYLFSSSFSTTFSLFPFSFSFFFNFFTSYNRKFSSSLPFLKSFQGNETLGNYKYGLIRSDNLLPDVITFCLESFFSLKYDKNIKL